jgi:hypothetical protein
LQNFQEILLLIKIYGLAFIFVLFSCEDLKTSTSSSTETNYTEIRGNLSGSLSLSDSPYLVVETILVDSLDKLVINPGVKLFFTDSAHLIIRGELVSTGLQNKEILYTSFESSWNGIKILDSHKNSQMNFCIIENVRIDDSDDFDNGAIEVNNSSAIISNCVIQNNYSIQGGGITIINSDLVLTNTIFQQNTAVAFGGAVLSVESTTQIINNTFYKNISHNNGGGVVLISPQNDDIQNNIFNQNTSSAGDPRITLASGDTSGYSEKFNFLDEINADPKFLSETDFHLGNNSPYRNSGNPDPVFNDSDGSRNDIGAYGGPKGDW